MTLPLASRRTVRTWLLRAATEHRAAATAMLGLFAASTAAGLVGPQLLGDLVESVGSTATVEHVDRVAAAFLGFLLLQAGLKAWASRTAAAFGERLLAAAREQLVEHVVRLPSDTVEAAGSGELLSRATADVDKLDEGLRQAAPHILVAAVTVLLTAAAMVATSPPLAAVALVTVPFLVGATRWYRPRAVPTYERALAYWARVYAAIHETHEGGRTVDALGLAGRRIENMDRTLRVVSAAERRSGFLWAGFLAALEVAAIAPVAVLLLVGGWVYARGWVGIGELTAVLLYTRALAEPVGEVLGWLDELQIGNAALRRVLGVRELAPEPEGGDQAHHPAGSGLAVHDVEFGYRPDRRVLHGVSLTVAPGERLAVVGPSGAGKSTLGRMLAGVNRPTHGRVTVGGVDVTALPQARRRRAVMLVTQEQHVFAGTLRDNLTLAGPATDERLHAALDAVGWAAHLPDGLDTVLGTGGHPIRAADAQRLALARVLLADPAAVVLDEATSLLDGCPPAVLGTRTVVTIAHRLEAARDTDRVAVLADGRVTELGSHAELLAAGGDYARLWSIYRGGEGAQSG